jgi:hypothetical protein
VQTPEQVAGLVGIDALAAGHRHHLALDEDTGTLYAWGHNGSGQVGAGGLRDVDDPVVVLTDVISMAAGDGFSLAVRDDNTVWAWGRNQHGQLGLGDTADRLSPVQIPGVAGAASVAAGGQHSLILLTGGSVLACGNNEFGQLGLGTTTSSSSPVAIPGLTGVTGCAAGYFHSAALASGNDVRVWGRNFEGQCGGGASSPTRYATPQVLTGWSGTASLLVCGYHFTLILTDDGSILGMGSNSDGQLDGAAEADQDVSPKVLVPQPVPLAPDLAAPTPDPMGFALPPAALDGNSITMTALEATDFSGPVQYLFESTGPGGGDSDWQASRVYVDAGLTTGVTYSYRVKARDAVGNETAFSAPAEAVAMEDVIKPSPDPMSFASQPIALGASSVTMTASEAFDAVGVEYYFENVSGGGNDSGWQDSVTYVDSGLLPGTEYGYRVQARDKSSNRNATAFSPVATATTDLTVDRGGSGEPRGAFCG